MSMSTAAHCLDTPVSASGFAPVPPKCAEVHDDGVMRCQR